MKKILTILSSVICLHSLSSHGQCTGWLNGGTKSDAWNITIDAQNNTYVTGTYQGPATVGNASFADTGIFVIKYDSTGQQIWIENFSCANWLVFAPIHYSNNNLFLGFTFYDSVSIGNIQLTGSAGIPSIAVAELGVDGEVIWARTFPCTSTTILYALWNTASGRVLISGRYRGTLTMDDVTLTGPSFPSGYCVYLCELDQQTGDVLWAKSSAVQSSYSSERGYIIRTDAGKNILLGGYYSYKITFGNQTLDNSAYDNYYNQAPYLAKFDSNGNILWLRGGTGPLGYGNVYAIATDLNSNVYFSTIFDSTATIFGEVLDSHDGNFVIGKYSSSGDLLWLKQEGSHIPDSASICTSLHLNSNNTLTAYGWGYHELIFGADTLMSAGNADIFYCDLDTNGNNLSSNITGNIYSDAFYDVAYDENDHGYVAGVYGGDTTTLGDFGLRSNAIVDSFFIGNAFVWKNCSAGIQTYTDLETIANVSIFPDPVTDLLNVILPHNSTYSIEVVNLFGERMFQSKVDDTNPMQLEMKNFPAGIYFLSISDHMKNVMMRKFVKM